jgi:hypothetical protein
MSGTSLAVLLCVGIPVVAVAYAYMLVRLIRRAAARARAALETEGIVLDTGTQWITIYYKRFRARGIAIGVGVNKARAALVLTRENRIILVPGFRGRYWLTPSGVSVGIDPGGRLHIHSDAPSGQGASGTVDYHVAMPEPATWVNVLLQAGARPLTG